MSRLMSDAEIRRRKKLQGHISQTTSTLGLTGLATLGAATALKKKPGLFKKVPGLRNQTRQGLKDKATGIGIISGGIGGVGGYNFAAYTNAESRKKKPVVKRDEYVSPFEEGFYGEEGRAENFETEPVSKALGGVAAAPAGPRRPAGPAGPSGPGGMRALRPAGSLKPMMKKPTSPNVKAMRAVPVGQNTSGLSTPGR